MTACCGTPAPFHAGRFHPAPGIGGGKVGGSPQRGAQADSGGQSPRDRHIQLMAERGRMGWQKATECGRRNQAETAMARYKHLIGPKLRARSLLAQQGEVATAVAVLNK